MSETTVGVHIACSGSPISYASGDTAAAVWPLRSTLLSAIAGMLPPLVVARRLEAVHLTRSHQRIMGRAVRRTFKMID